MPPFNIQTAICSNVHHWVELRVESDSIGLSAPFCQESYTIYPTNHSQSVSHKPKSQLSSICSVACTFLDLLSCNYWTTNNLSMILSQFWLLFSRKAPLIKKSDNPLHVQVFYSYSKIQFPLRQFPYLAVYTDCSTG